jgi:predicted DNA-binding WGR domain protein
MRRREFQFHEGKSQKFWAVTVEGTQQTVQFGRIGTTGQTQQKTFSTPEAARQASEKLISEKLRKGYVEVSLDSASSAPPQPAPATKKREPRAVAPVAAPATPASAVAPEVPGQGGVESPAQDDASTPAWLRAALAAAPAAEPPCPTGPAPATCFRSGWASIS